MNSAMKMFGKFFNYIFILILLISQFALAAQWRYNYSQKHGLIAGFANGIKGNETTWREYSNPANVEKWERNYWIELFFFSVIVIGIPLVIALLHLKYREKRWIRILYYSAVVIFMLMFSLNFHRLFWRYY